MGLGSPLGQKGPCRCFVKGSDRGFLSKEKTPVRVVWARKSQLQCARARACVYARALAYSVSSWFGLLKGVNHLIVF